MNKIILSSTVIISLLSFNACSYKYTESPLATNFETSKQKKLQAASHWKIISEDLAKSVVEKIGLKNSIYISKPNNDLKFEKSMHKLLITSLVNKGMNVSIKRTSKDILVNLDVEAIKFTKDRGTLDKSAGVLTLLAAGLWSMNGIYESGSGGNLGPAAAAGGTVLAVGTDVYKWYNSEYASGPIPQNEIIITISAQKNNHYLANYNNIYYVTDDDENLYSNNATSLRLEEQ